MEQQLNIKTESGTARDLQIKTDEGEIIIFHNLASATLDEERGYMTIKFRNGLPKNYELEADIQLSGIQSLILADPATNHEPNEEVIRALAAGN